MTIEQLMKFRAEEPFDHEAYTIALHNAVIRSIREAINHRVEIGMKADYETCTLEDFLSAPEMQEINVL